MNTQNTSTDLFQKALSLMKNGQVGEYIRTLIDLHKLKNPSPIISTEQNFSA